MTLPEGFLKRPFAHRGLHDRAVGRIENSPGAFRAAVAAGYGIELDVQISRDGVPVVFHDATLGRLTALKGAVRDLTAAQLATVRLTGSGDTILPLADVLASIGAAVPVLVEIKAQPGGSAALARAAGAACRAARDRTGARVAIMSFDPDAIREIAQIGSDIPLGLTTGAAADDAADLAAPPRNALSSADGSHAPLAFVSHDHRHLRDVRVAGFRARGASILCWTVRSEAEARIALKTADQITFEGFRP
ncbi:glycerophosphodiester phosphodiesterase family protein [Palleronia rufa]|uniref:glycerophosphodiester phosphodiesterase family protein n=1 Tax=Palleronia rufa TaxID=1530186 RepID=UPI0005638790|nr:glycerophosphodiester phosphodiesterase family protein [Palleronia rufa]